MAKTKPIQTVADLQLDPHNANKGTPRGGALLDRSLDEVGAARGVFTDADGVVLGGNKTVERWKARGGRIKPIEVDGDELVVVVRRDLSLARAPKKARAAAYLDNQTSAVGLAWDPMVVAADQASGVVDLEGLGVFTAEEYSGIVASVTSGGAEAAPRELDAPVDKATKTAIRRGDVFALGRHRLACLDATKRHQVAAFMGGKRAELLFTDPPYGVQYQSKADARRVIQGDLSQSVIPLSFAVAVEVALSADARVYLCGGADNLQMYWSLFDHHLQMSPRPIIWDKGAFVLRRTNYHSQFEIIYFGWRGKGGGPKCWFGDRTQSDVWQVKRDASSAYLHPTQKPVELARRAILNSCGHGGLVFEPFSGSGSTLIAAEDSGRVCYAGDVDPLHVQTTINRWETLTKQRAEKAGTLPAGRGKGAR